MVFDSLQIQKRNTETTTAKMRFGFWAAIGLGLVALLCSCGSSNYGKLQSSQDITELFAKAQVLSDHVYYYSGLQGVPHAIIGIHPNYSLRSSVWKQVDFTHRRLKKWTFRMEYVHLVTPQGAWILGPNGDRLGIWYSAERQTSVRLDRQNRVVVVPPPAPELRGVP